jgi:hypothetical protein
VARQNVLIVLPGAFVFGFLPGSLAGPGLPGEMAADNENLQRHGVIF